MSNPVKQSARRSWRRIARITLSGTAACMLLSLGVNYLLLFSDRLTPFGRSVVSATLLPILIGVPIFIFIGIKLQELARSRREINRAASYDGLTGVVNGAAFSSIVERRAAPQQPRGKRKGAFLVVEAERIRAINARYGHTWGDEALKLVAETIRVSVRAHDIVGRIGADEFGVFLPGATEENALEIGERIRAGIAGAYFAPGGVAGGLDVRVGGVVFDVDLSFDDMFKAAERQLSEAGTSDRLRLSFVERDDRPLAH